ncbi:MAG: cation:proton antiporter [Desulfovibrionales bacterium]
MPELGNTAAVFLALGMMFVLGMVADILGRKTPLPRVTLLLLAGIMIGPAGFSLLPEVFVQEWFPMLTHVALAMVGFLLGQELTWSAIRKRGRSILLISVGEVLGVVFLVALALVLLGMDLSLALLLAGIAPASAPAAILDIVKETRIKDGFISTLLGVVAIDDAWGLLVFSFMLAAADALSGQGGALQAIGSGLGEIGGSIVLGAVLGLPMAYLTGRVRPGEPTQAEALGLVVLCSGAAIWLDLSNILAAMTMGIVVASLASHHERPFKEIDGLEWPFMILFFLLAGASLHLGKLQAVGWIGGAYILARIAGLYCGSAFFGRLAGADPLVRRWMGLSLLPQAGVALGLALLAAQSFPEFRDIILPVVIGSTVIFEIIGPVITRRVIMHVQAAESGSSEK